MNIIPFKKISLFGAISGSGNNSSSYKLVADTNHFQCLGTFKESINKMKRLRKEWEKISANHKPDKGLIYKIYNNSYNSTDLKNLTK